MLKHVLFAATIVLSLMQGGAHAAPIKIAVADFDYVDTSGEPNNQTDKHTALMTMFMRATRDGLTASGRFDTVALTCPKTPCTAASTPPQELLDAAKASGAQLLVYGGVHKMSTLVQSGKMQAIDLKQDRLVIDRLLTFRGDNEESFRRAAAFIVGEVVAFDRAPIRKIAVFDFELEDFSAGGPIGGQSAVETERLKAATQQTRDLLSQSGLFIVTPVDQSTEANGREHWLRKCNGCEADLARAAGADLSLLGVFHKISVMEQSLRFLVRDAATGEPRGALQTDLRGETDESWTRAVKWIVEHRILEPARAAQK
ncbi:MAG: DUF2380 domain-containing protein [Hyphomicrobiales bacterium]|nr:DUF2380 domain-containing protein [Hyphomicrobiales bacterium]